MSESNESRIREGETVLDVDPGQRHDATVAFIGHIRSAWQDRAECPRNIGGAREARTPARVELLPEFAAALTGLKVGQGVFLIYWMHHARRDLVIQTPRHADGPRGTFALRSPNRPNPLAMSCVTIASIDVTRGIVEVDAIDCLDGTPLVDIKPWLPSIDIPAGQAVAGA